MDDLIGTVPNTGRKINPQVQCKLSLFRFCALATPLGIKEKRGQLIITTYLIYTVIRLKKIT